VSVSEIAYDARVALHPLTAGFAEVAGVYEWADAFHWFDHGLDLAEIKRAPYL
jgi:hypothetical protein